ncbi:MAG: hypothetical protein FWH27_14465 [Planctomycetaceae bacterium]|nr:hypothetical protein [Planctomycetaceae bacterium]
MRNQASNCSPVDPQDSFNFNETVPRPVDAFATIERTPDTLTITVPSEMSSKSPGLRWFFVAIQLFYCLFVCGFVGWGLSCAMYGCRIFWNTFTFWPALGSTVLTFGVILALLCQLLLPLYAMCSQFAHWRLVLGKTEIWFEHRALFQGQKIVIPRPEGLAVEVGHRKLLSRQQLSLRYWLVYNPAMGMSHIRLNTEPLIVFPCVNQNERDWLLLVLNDFLQKCGNP